MGNSGFKVAAALGLALICAASAQQVPKKQKQGTPTIVTNVNTVPLVFLALDKHHHFYAGLQRSQIQIYDDNQLQQIQRFDAEGNLPLRIALLLDISNSISGRWAFEQRAATDFLQSVLKPGRDQAMVAGFDTSLHVAQPFTDNYEELAHAVSSLNPSGGTALYDALYYTAHNDFGAGTPGAGEVRNVIVIISDGADDQSRYSRDEALAMAEDVGAVIYTIGTEPTGSDPESDQVLERFAEQTGGRSYFPIQARDLGSAFQAITTDLRHQYVVAYSPNNFLPNGAFHTVEIRIDMKGITARTRKGYFAKAVGH
ncbi:MAG: VWA domain-containing protein [Terriglobales bacterium]